MKGFRNILMTAALVTVGILMSCGGGGNNGPGLTDGQKLLQAIDGTWSVNVSASNVEGVEGTPDLTGASVTINPNNDETGASFTLSGSSVTQYLTGGSFTVSDSGVIGSSALNAAGSSSLTVSTVTIVENGSTLTISASVAATSARGAGVGNWVLVFDID